MINQANIDSNQIQIDPNQIQIDPNQIDNQPSQIYEEINDHAYMTLSPSATNSSTNDYTHLNFNKSNKQKSHENKSKRLFEYVKSSKKRLAIFLITCILVGILLALTLVLIILGAASKANFLKYINTVISHSIFQVRWSFSNPNN